MELGIEEDESFAYLEREGLVLFELDQQDGLLVVRGHQLALSVSMQSN